IIAGDVNGNRWLDDGESWTESDPLNSDSDRDGLLDGAEVTGTNGYITDPRQADTDGDGLDDGAEPAIYGTDPTRPDTDHDGLSDGREVWLQTNPLDPDSDWDDMPDGTEIAGGTSPLDPDSDGDGVWDGADPWPQERDHDQDGLWDGQELVPDANGLRFEAEDFSGAAVEDYAVALEFVNPAIGGDIEVLHAGLASGSELIAEIGMKLIPPGQRVSACWDYDRQAVGTVSSDWQGDPLTVTDIDSHSGSHALLFVDGDGGARASGIHLFRPAQGQVRLDFWLNADIVDGSFEVAVVESAASPDGMRLILDREGTAYYATGATTVEFARDLVGWHRFRLESRDLDAGTYTVWLDGQVAAAAVAFAGDPQSLSRVVIGDADNGGRSTGSLYVDDIAFQAASQDDTGMLRLAVRSRTLLDGANGALLNVVLLDQAGAPVYEGEFPVAYDLYRWTVTPDIEVPAGDYVVVLLDRTGAEIAVDKLLVAWGDPAPHYYLTQADVCDADGDLLDDGLEATATDQWIEAEHYSRDRILIREFVDDVHGDDSGLEASNGYATTHQEAGGEIAYVPPGPLYPAGTYQVYVRARLDPTEAKNPALRVTAMSEATSVSEAITLTDRFQWHTTAALTLTLHHPGTLTVMVEDAGNPSESVLVDKILLTQRFAIRYSAKDWTEQPRNLSDPLDPDTDGDGFRPVPIDLPNSEGYLIDGWERLIVTNPFDLDTDDDAPVPGDPGVVNPGLTDDADNQPLSDDGDGDGLKVAVDPDDSDDDCDDDGILDGNEDANLNGVWEPDETDPLNPDTDGDTILDGTELGLSSPQGNDTDPAVFVADKDPRTRTDPLATDSDGDGLADGTEDPNADGMHDSAREPTDAAAPDTDRDLLDDGTEDADGDGAIAGDSDGDRQMDAGETWTETDPAVADTDGDGLGDGQEVLSFDTSPVFRDSDGDGLEDGPEILTYATDPNDADSDEDDLSDYVEVIAYATLPLTPDTDGDGLDDGTEVTVYTTDPLATDSDDDGLADSEEVVAGQDGFVTNPLDPDGDGDGVIDGLEAQYGWNPTDTVTPSAPAAGQTFEMAQVHMAAETAWVNSPTQPGVLVTHGLIYLGDANNFSVDLNGTLTVTLATGEMVGAGEIRVSLRGRTISFAAQGPIEFYEPTGIVSFTVDQQVDLLLVPPVSADIHNTVWIDLDNGSLTTDGVVQAELIRTEGEFVIWPSQGIVSLGTQAVPVSFTLTLPDPLNKDVTFGTAYASLNLSDTLAFAGAAALTLPDLPGGATLSLPGAAFLVDFDAWHFVFDVDSSFELELGSVTVGVEGPAGAHFELAIESGYLSVDGGFDLPPLELEGTLEIDLYSNIEPNVWYTPTHTTSQIGGFKGHYRVETTVPIPLPPPPLPPGPAALNLTGETVMRLPFLDPDLDPLEPPSYGANGTCELEVGVGVASLGFELGGTSAAIDFTNKKIYFASESGIALGDLVEGLPAGLGNIGLGPKAQAEFIFDWDADPAEYVAYTSAISDVYTMPVSSTILVGSGRYNYYGFQADVMFLVDFDLVEAYAGDHVGGLYMGGSLNLPIDVGTPVSVTGGISWEGDLLLSGVSNIEIAGHHLAGATVTLTNDALALSGMVDMPGVGSAAVAGTIAADGTYAFTGTAALTPGGFNLAGATVLFNNNGLWVDGQLTLPEGMATVAISGTVTPLHYHFEGVGDLALGGFQLAAAQVVVDSSTGLIASGAVTVPNAGSVSLYGAIHPSGAFTLTGSGTLSPYDVDILNASFALARPAGGPVTFTGTGAVLAGGQTLASASLTIRSDGYISGTGTLTWSAVSATAWFALDPSGSGGTGSFDLGALVSVGKTVNGYGVEGAVSFSASGSALGIAIGATFSGSVTAAGYALADLSVGVSSNGAIQISGLPYPCPSLTDPLRICHSSITLDIL
ncbi:MAG: hypothetical protein JXC32_05235, partial [Anaerolineae bacterium]|nr:hypothetical protein [Anaerolineae bacterium]